MRSRPSSSVLTRAGVPSTSTSTISIGAFVSKPFCAYVGGCTAGTASRTVTGCPTDSAAAGAHSRGGLENAAVAVGTVVDARVDEDAPFRTATYRLPQPPAQGPPT